MADNPSSLTTSDDSNGNTTTIHVHVSLSLSFLVKSAVVVHVTGSLDDVTMTTVGDALPEDRPQTSDRGIGEDGNIHEEMIEEIIGPDSSSDEEDSKPHTCLYNYNYCISSYTCTLTTTLIMYMYTIIMHS